MDLKLGSVFEIGVWFVVWELGGLGILSFRVTVMVTVMLAL
jgi:hypothetical protein